MDRVDRVDQIQNYLSVVLHLKDMYVLVHMLIMSCLQNEVFIFPDSPVQRDLDDQVLCAMVNSEVPTGIIYQSLGKGSKKKPGK